MAEEIVLAAPVQANPGASRFRLAGIWFDWDRALITVRLREWSGTVFGPRELVVTYEGTEATTLMVGLNKANLATKSLHTRVLEKLAADAKLPPGTISGVAD